MGTRSTLYLVDVEEKAILASIYRHSDGQPCNAGLEYANFLKRCIVKEDYSVKDAEYLSKMGRKLVCNGFGCMAAKFISHIKGEMVGQYYLIPQPYIPRRCFDLLEDYYGISHIVIREQFGKHALNFGAEYFYIVSYRYSTTLLTICRTPTDLIYSGPPADITKESLSLLGERRKVSLSA